MEWDWIAKGAKRVQELGTEYKQHHTLVERLLTLDAAAAQDEVTRAWLGMDERTRAGLKMTLAGITLGQQAASSSAGARLRADRLKAMHALIDTLSTSAPAATTAGPSAEATITSSAARMTQKLADVAEHAKPRAAEMIEHARKGLEEHGPAIEAAVNAVITEMLKAEVPAGASNRGTAGGATSSQTNASAPREQEPVVMPPVPEEPAFASAPRPSAGGSTTIAGEWVGTLHRPGTTDTLGCNQQVAANGHPVWTYSDSKGVHQVELTRVGQKVQYVPPELGVVTVIVQSVTGSPTTTGYVVDYSFERSNNGYMTQRYQRIALAGRLRGSQLEVTYSESGTSSFGDKTGLSAGTETRDFSGSLTKQS